MISFKQFLTESPKQFYDAISEYVGANVPLNLKKYSVNIIPYVRKYSKLYRIWQDYGPEDLPVKLPKRPYIATSKSLKAIEEMAHDNDLMDNLIVTQHSGKGIDVIEVLKNKFNFFGSDYVKRILKMNENQEEVLLLDTPLTITKKDMVGVYDGNRIIK